MDLIIKSNLFSMRAADDTNFFREGALEYVDIMKDIIEKFKTLIVNMLNAVSTGFSGDMATAAVVAAGVTLAELFLVLEMFSQVSSMRFEGRIEDGIQLWIKLVVAKIIIENSSKIVSAMFEFFIKLGNNSVVQGFDEIKEGLPSISGDFLDANKGILGIGYIFACLIMAILTVVVAVIMMMIAIQVFGIIFEIGIHMAIAPIAMSTLCNSTFRSTGMSFIKSFAAVCLQTTAIGAIFSVYSKFAGTFAPGSIAEGGGIFGIIFKFLTPLLSLIVLSTTVKKSGEITKRMLGA